MQLFMLRCFEDNNIVHVDGTVNPVRDKETIILNGNKRFGVIEKLRDKNSELQNREINLLKNS